MGHSKAFQYTKRGINVVGWVGWVGASAAIVVGLPLFVELMQEGRLLARQRAQMRQYRAAGWTDDQLRQHGFPVG